MRRVSPARVSPEDRQQRRSRSGARLGPVAHVSAEELQLGQRALVLDLAWASLSAAFSGGVILAAFERLTERRKWWRERMTRTGT
jgi:hypothetical protein